MSFEVVESFNRDVLASLIILNANVFVNCKQKRKKGARVFSFKCGLGPMLLIKIQKICCKKVLDEIRLVWDAWVGSEKWWASRQQPNQLTNLYHLVGVLQLVWDEQPCFCLLTFFLLLTSLALIFMKFFHHILSILPLYYTTYLHIIYYSLSKSIISWKEILIFDLMDAWNAVIFNINNFISCSY